VWKVRGFGNPVEVNNELGITKRGIGLGKGVTGDWSVPKGADVGFLTKVLMPGQTLEKGETSKREELRKRGKISCSNCANNAG